MPLPSPSTDKKGSVPVLIIAHRRSGDLAKVLSKLREFNPRSLYIATDGWNSSKLEFENECTQTRKVAAEYSDWASEVHFNHAQQLMGLRLRVTTAIDWFFSHEAFGIILEEDCVPSKAFYESCEVLLPRFEHDLSIGQISGHSFAPALPKVGAGSQIKFSSIRISNSWGWATWNTRWEWNQLDRNNLSPETVPEDFKRFDIHSPLWPRFWIKTYRQIQEGSLDSWAFHWARILIRHKAYSLSPNQSLVDNIGLSGGGTHYTRKQLFSLEKLPDLTAITAHFPSVRPPLNRKLELLTAILGPKIYGKYLAFAVRFLLWLAVTLRGSMP